MTTPTAPHVPSLAQHLATSLGLEIVAHPDGFELTGSALADAGVRWTFASPYVLLSRLLLLEAAQVADPTTFAL